MFASIFGVLIRTFCLNRGRTGAWVRVCIIKQFQSQCVLIDHFLHSSPTRWPKGGPYCLRIKANSMRSLFLGWGVISSWSDCLRLCYSEIQGDCKFRTLTRDVQAPFWGGLKQDIVNVDWKYLSYLRYFYLCISSLKEAWDSLDFTRS
jgi:hypothetical protein